MDTELYHLHKFAWRMDNKKYYAQQFTSRSSTAGWKLGWILQKRRSFDKYDTNDCQHGSDVLKILETWKDAIVYNSQVTCNNSE